jgi:hypothetical protein
MWLSQTWFYTLVSPFYFKIVCMKFIFEMLFNTFPPSPVVIYFFIAHLTSCQSSRIYFRMVCPTGFPSTPTSNNFLCFYLFLNSYWNFNNSRRHASFFFHKLVSSSDFVYRSDNYFREPVNRTIDRPIRSWLVNYSPKRPGKEWKKIRICK